MSRGIERRVKKQYPQVMKRIRNGDWLIDLKRSRKHVALRHVSSGRLVTLASSPSCSYSERRIVNTMTRIERGEEHR
jgi:hypothetical protein